MKITNSKTISKVITTDRVIPMTNAVTMKKHPLYVAAKAGDVDAAMKLVNDLMKDEKIKVLYNAFPNAIVAAPHAIEAAGHNAIPIAMSIVFAVNGFDIDETIVQTVRAFRTGKTQDYRMTHRPTFTGTIKSGREYIILDDLVANGSTISELRYFIEKNGGHVVAIVSMACSLYSTVLALSAETKAKLYELFTPEQLRSYARVNGYYDGNIEYITEREARAIISSCQKEPVIEDQMLAQETDEGYYLTPEEIEALQNEKRSIIDHLSE